MLLVNVAAVVGHIISANSAIWLYATEENAKTFFYVEPGVVDCYILTPVLSKI